MTGVQTCALPILKPADLRVARRFFCDGEYRYVAGQKSETGQQEAFFRLWTLKESFVKAAGAGLLIPLNSFEIKIMPGDCSNYILENNTINNNPGIKILQNTDSAKYCFRSYMENGYCAAVCLREKDVIGTFLSRPFHKFPDTL